MKEPGHIYPIRILPVINTSVTYTYAAANERVWSNPLRGNIAPALSRLAAWGTATMFESQ